MNTKLIVAFALILHFTFYTLHSPATQYSKLSIITAAKECGRWPALKAWIAEAGYEDEWNAASFLSDDYPQFAAITNAVVLSGVASPSEVAAILSASVDTSIPDAYIRNLYERDMASKDGRTRWHGAKVREVVDTNTLTKVSYYEDGTSFTDAAKVVTPLDSAKAANAKLPPPVMTNGIPARLANARLRQRENSTTTNEVTVTVKAGGQL